MADVHQHQQIRRQVGGLKPEPKPRQRVVLSPLLTAKMDDGNIRYFYKGDVLPEGVSDASLAHLESIGYIT